MFKLELDNISKSFPGHPKDVEVLRNVSLLVKPRELVAVQGSSGSGKTTLLLTAAGLLGPVSGRVLLDGRDMYSLTRDQRSDMRAVNIGFVFQQYHLLPYLTVLENIMLPVPGLSLAAARCQAKELLVRLKLDDRADHLPSQLSTGQRQRVALGRALLNAPKLILADEPTGNLDKENAELVMDYLSDFANEGAAVLLASHDSRVIGRAHRVLRLQGCELVRSCGD